jgi:hypothetical protein
MAQGRHQRAVAAHRVPADGAAIVGGERGLDERGQFLRHVGLHAEVRRPRRLRGIDVEAGALSEVVAVGVGHAFATRAGIGRHENQTKFCTGAAEFAFLGHICMGAGQTRQKPYHWQNLAFFMRRDID